MKSVVENLEPTRVKITVETPYEEIESAVEKAYREIAGQVNIPGFRKGKAPKRIIDQRVGRGVVLEQAVNEVLPNLYREAIVDNGIKVLGQPEVDVTEIPAATGPLGGQLAFTAEVDVRPEITFPDLSGVEVEVDPVEITDEDVEAELTALRERFGSLVGVDRAAKSGDYAVIDLSATIDGEEIESVSGVSYEIGSGSMLEGLDDALTGLKSGEEATFTTTLVGGEHEGQEADCTVVATSVKERDLPEADDEFAELASEFDTIDELREDLKVQVAKNKASEQAFAARDKLMEHLRENVDFPLPEALVEAEITQHLAQEGKEGDEEHAAEIRPDIERALRDQLMLDALAEEREVQVGQDELIDYMVQTARQYGMDPGQFLSSAMESNQVPIFMAELARNKSLIYALKDVTVKDTAGEEVDLSEFLALAEEGEDEAPADEAAQDADAADEQPAADED
ncbi:MAG: trigger factor [Bowdeniella nasicola]|nr:trigger factor [Bowdeniella nasicola]